MQSLFVFIIETQYYAQVMNGSRMVQFERKHQRKWTCLFFPSWIRKRISSFSPSQHLINLLCLCLSLFLIRSHGVSSHLATALFFKKKKNGISCKWKPLRGHKTQFRPSLYQLETCRTVVRDNSFLDTGNENQPWELQKVLSYLIDSQKSDAMGFLSKRGGGVRFTATPLPASTKWFPWKPPTGSHGHWMNHTMLIHSGR